MTTAKCKQYDLSGNECGEVEVEYSEDTAVNSQLIKDYIIALRTNARQWSANTKTRSEANCSGAKPHRQKGTGKARQGSLCSPQYKGGYRVHAPKPKFNQHVRINRKERRAAIRSLLIESLNGSIALCFGKRLQCAGFLCYVEAFDYRFRFHSHSYPLNIDSNSSFADSITINF